MKEKHEFRIFKNYYKLLPANNAKFNGMMYVLDITKNDALFQVIGKIDRAQQRLGLDGNLRDYKLEFTIEDSKIKVTGPRMAKPGRTGPSGGGLEYSTGSPTRIKIRKISKLKNAGR